MLVIKLLSVIVILCAIILLIQLLQLCMMSKRREEDEDFSIERFEEVPLPLDEENDVDSNIVGKEETIDPLTINNEMVTRDLNDIELSTNNMLLKIQSIKNKMEKKKDDSSIPPFKDFVAQRMERMKRMQPPTSLDDVMHEKQERGDGDDMHDGPMVEGFVDGLSHNCSTY